MAGVLMLGFVISMIPDVLSGKVLECTLLQITAEVPIKFRVDGLGLLFGLVASSLWIVSSLYSVGYMRALKEHSQTRFFVFFAIQAGRGKTALRGPKNQFSHHQPPNQPDLRVNSGQRI